MSENIQFTQYILIKYIISVIRMLNEYFFFTRDLFSIMHYFFVPYHLLLSSEKNHFSAFHWHSITPQNSFCDYIILEEHLWMHVTVQCELIASKKETFEDNLLDRFKSTVKEWKRNCMFLNYRHRKLMYNIWYKHQFK